MAGHSGPSVCTFFGCQGLPAFPKKMCRGYKENTTGTGTAALLCGESDDAAVWAPAEWRLLPTALKEKCDTGPKRVAGRRRTPANAKKVYMVCAMSPAPFKQRGRARVHP